MKIGFPSSDRGSKQHESEDEFHKLKHANMQSILFYVSKVRRLVSIIAILTSSPQTRKSSRPEGMQKVNQLEKGTKPRKATLFSQKEVLVKD